PEVTDEPEVTEEPDIPEPTDEPASTEPIPAGGVTEESTDLASFTYTIDGVTYQFPTAVSQMKTGSLPLDLQAALPAVNRGNAEDIDQALRDTQFYHYSTDIYMELIGVTNLTGAAASAADGVITELVDTRGDQLDLVLPGNVRIGEPVINLVTSFPEFLNVAMDGTATYRDNDTIYAANYRPDGCYGYVILKNNAPYYSALSIVCDNGTIREISMECLGAAQLAQFF
ncbi:MAG: hypothetical protein Q4B09_08015, partial [Lachnospiraceae bacterium]|nr:hypothetical protein [Lachnospiraceae bacterium]